MSAMDERKLFVGGLPQDVESKDVREHFSAYGAVTNVDMKTDHYSGRCRGFCFVTFEDSESVEKALAKEEHKILNCVVGIKKAQSKPGKVYLGNLPSPEEISKDDIVEHFSQLGVSVLEVVRPVDKSKNNEPKTFAFITFAREETAKDLIKEASIKIKSHDISVRRVTPAKDNSTGGQRGGKREFDRKSGDVRTGIKPKEKTGGNSSKSGSYKSKRTKDRSDGDRRNDRRYFEWRHV